MQMNTKRCTRICVGKKGEIELGRADWNFRNAQIIAQIKRSHETQGQKNEQQLMEKQTLVGSEILINSGQAMIGLLLARFTLSKII